MYVVTGATGNVGGAVARRLAELGAPTRAVLRDPAGTDLPAGVTSVAGDLGSPEALREAFAGADAVFLLPGYPGLATAARDAGAARIVQLSGGSGGSADLANAMTRYMRESEEETRATGLEWTVLRPTAFMSNLLRWVPQLEESDTLRLPFADVPLAMVHPADIADVAVTAMTEPGHEDMVYRPTGPRALLPEEQVALLADGLGRPLVFEAQGNSEARRVMLETTPAPYVAAWFDFYVNGTLDETTVRPTVLDVTGHPPRTLEEWIAEHVDDFPGG